jgi:hypothetical protein
MRKVWHFENVPNYKTGGSGYHGLDPNLSRDFTVFGYDSPIHGKGYVYLPIYM